MEGGFRKFWRERRMYWLYIPLFWILLIGGTLFILNGRHIVPFLYRTL
jgi:hypothetical protein